MKTEIRLATIGCDAGIGELVQAASRMPQFSLVEAFEVDDVKGADSLRQAMPRVSKESANWENFVSGDMADVVAVGTSSDGSAATREQRDRTLRRLVQASVPLVTVHPVCEMLLAYELDMIRRDTDCILFPYIPFLSQRQVREAIEQLAHASDESISGVEQYAWERSASAMDRADERSLWHLSRDVIVLRRLLGEVTSVSATGGGASGHLYDNLSVHLAGPADQTTFARWSIGPGEPGARLNAQGEPAWTPLILSADGHSSQWLRQPNDTTPVESTESTAEQFLKDVAATLSNESRWTGVGWDDVCRSLEVTDAVKRSIARRRTIELYHEQVTEQDTFKSMMAAGGCGMLLWVMLLLMIGGVVEGLRLPIRDTAIWSLWPVALFMPLAIFLAMQLLQFLFDARDD